MQVSTAVPDAVDDAAKAGTCMHWTSQQILMLALQLALLLVTHGH